MKINVVDPYKDAAVECAYFVYESEWLQNSYDDHISSGEDSRDHVLYSSAVILNKTENFQDDINEYIKIMEDHNDYT